MDVEEGPRRGVENMPWVEKYRPRTLDELLSHDQIISTCTPGIARIAVPTSCLYPRNGGICAHHADSISLSSRHCND